MENDMKRAAWLVVVGVLGFCCMNADGCGEQSSDTRQREQQEAILLEATAAVGMPAVKNFRERRLLKDIIELRDQEGLVTYTYLFSDMTGKIVFLGESIGYGIPYATQYTNPEKVFKFWGEPVVLPQADPNALFSPQSAEGTWVLLKEPGGKTVRPVYVEPRIIVSPFQLPETLLAAGTASTPSVPVEK